MTLFRTLASLAALSIFVQIVLGAVVRLTDSGLSCPDWPLCYGLWFPTPDKLAALPSVDYTFGQVMAEWTHRLNAAAVVSPLVLIMLILAVRLRRSVPTLLPTMIAAAVVLLAQAGLGGFTVLDRNSPVVGRGASQRGAGFTGLDFAGASRCSGADFGPDRLDRLARIRGAERRDGFGDGGERRDDGQVRRQLGVLDLAFVRRRGHTGFVRPGYPAALRPSAIGVGRRSWCDRDMVACASHGPCL